MVDTPTACSAYREGEWTCANGFPQLYVCRGHGKCWTCGRDDRTLPHCMRDTLPEHWINDDGSPRFYGAGRIAPPAKDRPDV